MLLETIVICISVIFSIAVVCGTWERVAKLKGHKIFSSRGLDGNE